MKSSRWLQGGVIWARLPKDRLFRKKHFKDLKNVLFLSTSVERLCRLNIRSLSILIREYSVPLRVES